MYCMTNRSYEEIYVHVPSSSDLIRDCHLSMRTSGQQNVPHMGALDIPGPRDADLRKSTPSSPDQRLCDGLNMIEE